MTIGVAPWARVPIADDGHEIAGRIHLLEIIETGLRSLRRMPIPCRGLPPERTGWPGSSGARIACQRDGVGVFGLEEIGPVLRHFLDDVGVHHEGEHRRSSPVPVTVGVLRVLGDRVPGRDLVGMVSPSSWPADRRRSRRRSRRAPGDPCCPCWRGWRSSSSADPASGFSSLTVISGYFFLKPAMTSP